MQITWLGHSCFVLQSEAGTTLMMDPPSPKTGYLIPPRQVDGVTSSHDHYDHAYFPLAEGAARFTVPGAFALKDMRITGFSTFHDKAQGALRGKNIMFLVEVDGIRILHAGDLGALPDEATLNAIGQVDVLLVPVGGNYTIGVREALDLCNLLHIRVSIPMHYATPDCNINLAELIPFLNASRDCAIHRMREDKLTLTRDSLGEDRIVVLEYKHPWKEDEA